MSTKATRSHVENRWQETGVASLGGLERLVYRSNRLGDDQSVTNTGGGNTSSKIIEQDPLTGEDIEVLWVKGSGGDLRTSQSGHFASLRMQDLHQLKDVYASRPTTGIKSEAEDEMVGLYRECVHNLNPRASSIDTPLHAFIPAKHVDHTHPNAVIAIAACERGEEVAREVYGDEVPWLPWMRPGFELGLALQELCEQNPQAVGAIMGQHGLINWADEDQLCYERSIELIERAAVYLEEHDRGDATFGGQRFASLDHDARRSVFVSILPWLRGRVSAQRRMIGTIQDDDAMLPITSRGPHRIFASFTIS